MSRVQKAPDGGWGYACVLGMLQSQMLFGLVVRTFGVLYLLTIDRFQTTATVVSWIGATNVLAWGVCSPFASMMCHKYNCRKVAAAGSLLQCLGFMVCAFSNHIAGLYLGYGLLVGCGVSCSTTSGYLIVSMYFNKKRSIATAIGSSGSSLAVFCMPPLVNFLAEYYGFQGCLLILSGLSLQGLVSASLFRPLQSQKGENVNDHDEYTTSNGPSTKRTQTTLQHDQPKATELKTIASSQPELPCTDQPESRYLQLKEENQSDHFKSTENMFESEIPTPLLKRKVADASELGVKPSEAGEEKQVDAAATGSRWCGLRDRFLLLKQEPIVTAIICVNVTAAVLSSTFSTFTPALARDQGYPRSVAVLLISFGGVADIVGRISLGFVMDSRCIRRRRLWLYCGCGVVSSITVALVPVIPSFTWYTICAVVNSTFMGTVFGQRSTVLADQLGVQRMAPVFGIVQLANALGLTIGTGIGGVLRDQLHTYRYNFHLAGLISLTGFTVLLALQAWKHKSALSETT